MPSQRPKTRTNVGRNRALVVHMLKDLNPPSQRPSAEPLTICRMLASPDGVERRDIDNWLSIQNEAFQRRSRPWTRSDFEREIARRSWFRTERLWLARPAEVDSPVGTIALELRGEPVSGRIHWLAVHSLWRRQGIGRGLVEVLERECWQQGGRQVVLETLGRWDSVIRFYQSLGYREIHGNSAVGQT